MSMRTAFKAIVVMAVFTIGFLITSTRSHTADAMAPATAMVAVAQNPTAQQERLVYVPSAAPAITAKAVLPSVTKRARAFAFALTKRGGPYVWGGNGPRGYDCSGLVVASYAHVGIYLPRTTYGILGSGKLRHISKNQARPGDLWFPSSGHVEFYYTNLLSFGAHHSGTLIGSRPYYTGGTFYHVIGS